MKLPKRVSVLSVLFAAVGLIVGCPIPDGGSTTTPIPPPEQVETPRLNYASGTYSGDLLVEITDTTPGGIICYTTDGSPPNSSSPAYCGPIAVTGNGTVMWIRAYAWESGMSDSSLAGARYTINYSQVSTPNFSPPPGLYTSDQGVSITDFTEGATICYTTDGSDPNSSSPGGSLVVKGPTGGMMIQAYAWKSGMSDSTLAWGYYGIMWPRPPIMKVICTELHRQGLMDETIWKADEAFGQDLSDNHRDVLLGYQLWAKPVVKWMQKSTTVTRIVASIATPWSYEMAYRMGARDKGSVEGKILMFVGVPVCRAIGRVMIWAGNMSPRDDADDHEDPCSGEFVIPTE